MNFTHYDLGNLDKGRMVEIILQGNAANVQLLDSSNFNNYRNGRQYRYIGGLAKKSPIRLQTTHSGHWHVAIDLRGMRGSVRSSVRVLPEALPEIKQIPLNTVPSLIHNRGLDDTTGDEETALNSVYQLFPITRDILKNKGRNAENFTKIAVIVLNQIVRPFTAKWHKKKLNGDFLNENECIQFRTELKQLQAELICYSRLLADMAKVEDLTRLSEEDKE